MPPLHDLTQAAVDRASPRRAPDLNPALIGIDWGSSNLRAALLDAQGRVIERRENSAGVFTVKEGHFAEALWTLCADWLSQHHVPLLACGMIGSRQGIVDVPYVSCPAHTNDLAGQLREVELQRPASETCGVQLKLHIVPGLKTGSESAGWDVMRGEETQLMGVAQAFASLSVLPGTHSKWIHRDGSGRIKAFQTYMTGELYELLCRHSSLGRVMSPAKNSPATFLQGITEANADSIENLLFHVRTAGLMGRFQPDEIPDYLSGLLIGAEVKAGLNRFAQVDPQVPISLLGSAQLTQRYAMAFARVGQAVIEIPGDAVFNGLFLIAREAGLLPIGLSSC